MSVGMYLFVLMFVVRFFFNLLLLFSFCVVVFRGL